MNSDAALGYAARGWAVFPLCPLRPTGCACGLDGQLGKHPVHGVRWRDQSTTDEQTVRQWWEQHPDAGIGIDCGKSGLVVIDVDPDGKDWPAQVGITANHIVQTPRGGLHLYYSALPGFDIFNSQGKISTGIDVRGRGGFVVAPPSRTPHGVYAQVLNLSLTPAPDLLVEFEAQRHADLDEIPTPRAPGRPIPAGYLAKAIEGAVYDYEHAPRGMGEHAGIAALCRIFELFNADWSDFDLETALVLLDAARVARRNRLAAYPGAGQSEKDFRRMVRSAQQRVGGRGAPAPREPQRLKVGGVPMGDSGATPRHQEPGVTPSADSQNPGHSDRHGGQEPASTDHQLDSSVTALIGEMLTTYQLDGLPAPRWLVRDWLQLDSIGSIIGRSGHMKSFVALDMAAAVALGQDWHGYQVRKGLVVYVVAEGALGIRQRIRAWELVNDRRLDGLLVLPRPVQARSAEWDVLVAALATLQPTLVILDTQARVTVGIDENSNTDIGVFVERMEEIRRATACCAVVVHHLGKAGVAAGGRGASAAYAAWTSELTVVKDESGVIRVSSSKEKDSADDLALEFEPVVVGEDGQLGFDEFQLPITSVVLQEVSETKKLLARSGVKAECKLAIIGAIIDLFPAGETFTRSKLSPVITKDFSRPTFFRAFKEMVDDGLLRPDGDTRVNTSYRYIPVEARIAERADETRD